jgi:hypothetical protein
LVALLFCIPLAANWDRTIPDAKCGSLAAESISVGTINLLIDVSIIVLPMPVLWNLQLPVRKKIGLTAIFGIGALYVHISQSNYHCIEVLIECLLEFASSVFLES